MFAFGDGEEQHTGALVKRFGGTKVLLVYGSGSVKRNGAYAAVTGSLQKAGIPFAELSGIQANPRSGKVYEGIELVRREGCDFLLALGGGSVIDTAKAIGFGAGYHGDFWDFFTGEAAIETTLPVGVVLTIAAAGSEGSDSCVITQEEGNLKWGCPKTDLIRPKFAVLNPRFTCSLPAYQIACGAVDMLAHICERYFTNTPDVGLTDRLCEALLKTILDAAPKAVALPEDTASHADLMWAGMLAHNDLCGTGRVQDWASHQIEHELSAFYDCAHGAGLAVVLPAWMDYVCGHNPMRFARFAVNVFGCEINLPGRKPPHGRASPACGTSSALWGCRPPSPKSAETLRIFPPWSLTGAKSPAVFPSEILCRSHRRIWKRSCGSLPVNAQKADPSRDPLEYSGSAEYSASQAHGTAQHDDRIAAYSMWGTSFFLDVGYRIPHFSGKDIQYLAALPLIFCCQFRLFFLRFFANIPCNAMVFKTANLTQFFPFPSPLLL